MKCIMCNRSSGSMIYGIKQNYLVCSECLEKCKPQFKSRVERVISVQLELEDRLNKYMLGV